MEHPQTEKAEDQCDECEEPVFKVQKDASNIKHSFCKKHWEEHVDFSGNEGKPYGF